MCPCSTTTWRAALILCVQGGFLCTRRYSFLVFPPTPLHFFPPLPANLQETLLRHIEDEGEGEEGHRDSGSSSRKKSRLLSAAAPSVLGALLASPLVEENYY